MADRPGSWNAAAWAKPAQRRRAGDLVDRLTQESAQAISEAFASNIYRPGTVIFYRSHVPVACYLVRHGSVILEFGSGNRAARGLVIESPAILGYRHVLHGTGFPVTARAITAAVVTPIPRSHASRLKLGRS